MLLTQELIERMRCTTEEKRSCLPLVDELLYCWSSHGRVVDMRNWVGDGSHKVWVRDKYGECLLPLPVSYDKEACGVELFRTVLINEVREAILREEYYLGSSNPLIAIFGLDFYEDINKLSGCDTHSAYHHYPKSFQTVSLSEIDRQIQEIACDSPAFRKKVELCIPELVIMMQTARCEGLMALDFLEKKTAR